MLRKNTDNLNGRASLRILVECHVYQCTLKFNILIMDEQFSKFLVTYLLSVCDAPNQLYENIKQSFDENFMKAHTLAYNSSKFCKFISTCQHINLNKEKLAEENLMNSTHLISVLGTIGMCLNKSICPRVSTELFLAT